MSSQHSEVCSKYFDDDDDYQINARWNKKLKINAIPKSTMDYDLTLFQRLTSLKCVKINNNF